ncbi:MAG: lycopene cyclase [Halobacteriales archaeon]
MAVARHGAGPTATARALASQVHPVFMLPPLAASAFGAVLAGQFEAVAGGVHLAAIFLAVYTAHVKDGYVDFHVRGEDDDHPLTVGGCRLTLVAAAVAYLGAMFVLWTQAGGLAAMLTAPTWLIGYFHAPQLDTNPLGATLGYPVGVALALVGGFAASAGVLTPVPVAFAAVLLIVLSGVKVVDDATDLGYDRSIEKRTVPVVLGADRARTLANVLLGAGLVTVLWFTVDGVFPPSAPVAAVLLGAVAAVAARRPPSVATPLLVRGAYVFLAVLVAAVWYSPLVGRPLPDIGVFGPYTYLATEVAFGTLAALMLHRAGTWWSAARTIAVLYPLAYVWDWYTLEVGVFAIPLRTGIEFVGIPLEEHLFMVVVPALVIGIHETLTSDPDPA